MKNLLLLFFLSLSFCSLAQNWCPQGAEWTYNFYSMSGFGYEKAIYEKDTILKNRSCKKLSAKRVVPIYPFGPGFPPTGIDTVSRPAIYTYAQNDTVFFYYKQSFRPAYFFNAQVGDTLQAINFLGFDACDTVIQQVVDSSGIMQINNETLRFYVARHINFTNQILYPERVTIVEKIGAVDNYTLPHFTCVTDNEEHTLRCYKDDNFNLYQTNLLTDCDYLYTSLSNILDEDILSVEVMPNPSTLLLNIRSKHQIIEAISLFNLNGQLQVVELIHQGNKEHQLNVSNLSPGIYFANIRLENGRNITKRIIK